MREVTKSYGQTSEVEFAEFLAPAIRKKGSMHMSEMKAYVKNNYLLTAEDLETIPSTGKPKWDQVVGNITSNRTYDRYPEFGIVRVDRLYKPNKPVNET